MALEKLDPKPLFQRINMTDHSRMVNAKLLGRAADSALARNLKSGPDFVPVVHFPSCALTNI
jgi:hypothetical protein